MSTQNLSARAPQLPNLRRQPLERIPSENAVADTPVSTPIGTPLPGSGPGSSSVAGSGGDDYVGFRKPRPTTTVRPHPLRQNESADATDKDKDADSRIIRVPVPEEAARRGGHGRARGEVALDPAEAHLER